MLKNAIPASVEGEEALSAWQCGAVLDTDERLANELAMLIPLVFKRQDKLDEDVIRGYKATYSYTMRFFGTYPALNGYLYYFFGFYQNFIFFAYLYFVGVYWMSIYLAFSYGDSALLSYELCYGFLTFVYFVVVLSVLHRRLELEDLFRIIGRGFYHYNVPIGPNEIRKRDRANRTCKKTFIKNIIISFFLTLWIALPSLLKGLQGDYSSVVEGGVPVNKNLLLPVWNFFSTDTASSFWSFSVFEILGCNTESFIISANCTLYCNFCTVLCSEIEMLCDSLRNIRHRAIRLFQSKGFSKSDDSRYEDSKDFQECMVYCLNESIQHHVALKKFYTALQQFLGFPILAIFTGMALTISSPLFTLVTIDQWTEENFEFALKIVLNTFLIGALGVFISSYCIFGQRLTNESSEIYLAFYETPWVTANKDFKLKVQMGMIHSQTPFVLSAIGIIPASGATLLDLMKTVFSYLNLLIAAT